MEWLWTRDRLMMDLFFVIMVLAISSLTAYIVTVLLDILAMFKAIISEHSKIFAFLGHFVKGGLYTVLGVLVGLGKFLRVVVSYVASSLRSRHCDVWYAYVYVLLGAVACYCYGRREGCLDLCGLWILFCQNHLLILLTIFVLLPMPYDKSAPHRERKYNRKPVQSVSPWPMSPQHSLALAPKPSHCKQFNWCRLPHPDNAVSLDTISHMGAIRFLSVLPERVVTCLVLREERIHGMPREQLQERLLQRILTFPPGIVPHLTVPALRLARNGFFYSGTGADGDDSVTCAFCLAQHSGWQARDDILGIHRRLSPHCPMVGGSGQHAGATALNFEGVQSVEDSFQVPDYDDDDGESSDIPLELDGSELNALNVQPRPLAIAVQASSDAADIALLENPYPTRDSGGTETNMDDGSTVYTGHSDHVRRVYCQQEISGWSRGSQVHNLHASLSQNCSMVTGHCAANIPLVQAGEDNFGRALLTNSNVGPDSVDYQQTVDEHGISAERGIPVSYSLQTRQPCVIISAPTAQESLPGNMSENPDSLHHHTVLPETATSSTRYLSQPTALTSMQNLEIAQHASLPILYDNSSSEAQDLAKQGACGTTAEKDSSTLKTTSENRVSMSSSQSSQPLPRVDLGPWGVDDDQANSI